MHILVIETKKHVKRIINPRNVKSIKIGFEFIVLVMDSNGKWHFIGYTINGIDCQTSVNEVNMAIQVGEEETFCNLS